MTYKELQTKSKEELKRLALELRTEERTLRFKVATRQLTQVHRLNVIRKDLARIETILGSKPTS